LPISTVDQHKVHRQFTTTVHDAANVHRL